MSGIGISVIGTPHGIESKSTGIAKGLAVDSIADIPNTIINVLPQTDILRIRREGSSSSAKLYYVYYRFAKETESSRTGGFYGSAVILDSYSADSTLLLQALYELANIVKNECLDPEDRFHKNIKSLIFKLPDSVRFLKDNLKSEPLNAVAKPRGGLFVPVNDSAEFRAYFEFLDTYTLDPILSEFQDIFLSTSSKVLDIVKERRGLPILNYKQLVEEVRRERELHRQRELEEQRRLDEIEREELRRKQQKEKEDREREERRRKEIEERDRQDRIRAKRLEKEDRDKQRKAARLKQQQERATQRPLNASFGGTGELSYNELKQENLRLRNRLEKYESEGNPGRKISYRQDLGHTRLGEWVLSVKWWGWGIFVVLIAIFIFLGFLAWPYLYPSQNFDHDSGGSRIRQRQLPVASPSSTSDSQPSVSPVSVDEQSLIQMKYTGSTTEISTVRELAKVISSECSRSCPGTTQKDIVNSLIQVNRSIGKKLNKDVVEASDEDVLNFELKKIDGPISFKVPNCCDLVKLLPGKFSVVAPKR